MLWLGIVLVVLYFLAEPSYLVFFVLNCNGICYYSSLNPRIVNFDYSMVQLQSFVTDEIEKSFDLKYWMIVNSYFVEMPIAFAPDLLVEAFLELHIVGILRYYLGLVS